MSRLNGEQVTIGYGDTTIINHLYPTAIKTALTTKLVIAGDK